MSYLPREVQQMKPHVLKAQTKDLYNYLKDAADLNRETLLEANKKTLKILLEINETLEKLQ